jgi:UDP-glucuronate 4-epimerase
MKILITGTAGFIGYSFSKYLLLNTNHKIIGIDNLNDYYPKKIKFARIKNLKKNKNFKFYKLDLSNKNQLKKIFKNNFNVVFHFAAQAGVRYSLINPRSYIDSNLNGFYNLIELVKKNSIAKFFYASSSSVYGESTKFPLSEKSLIKPKNIYGLTKKMNEELVELYFENSKTICVGLRFFTVFGEWGRPDMLIYKYLSSIYDKKKKFYLNNYGDHTRDFTYIEDVTEILFKLFVKKLNKKNIVVNICSNKPIKITKVIKIIDKNFKSKPKIFKRSFQKADVKKTHGNNALIKKISMKNNFSPITKALNNTAKWYREHWKLFT